MEGEAAECENAERVDQLPRALRKGEDDGRLVRARVGAGGAKRLARKHQEPRDIARVVLDVAVQHLQAVQLAGASARNGSHVPARG